MNEGVKEHKMYSLCLKKKKTVFESVYTCMHCCMVDGAVTAN